MYCIVDRLDKATIMTHTFYFTATIKGEVNNLIFFQIKCNVIFCTTSEYSLDAMKNNIICIAKVKFVFYPFHDSSYGIRSTTLAFVFID